MKAELVTLHGEYPDYQDYENFGYFPDAEDMQIIYSDPELLGVWAAIAKVGAKIGKGLFKGIRKAVRRKKARRKKKAQAAAREKAELLRQQQIAAYNRQLAMQAQAKKKQQSTNLQMAMLPLLALPLLLGE